MTKTAKRNDFLDSLPAAEAAVLAGKLWSGRRRADAAHVDLADASYHDLALELGRVCRDVRGTYQWIGY
jgi:hypothetical protein